MVVGIWGLWCSTSDAETATMTSGLLYMGGTVFASRLLTQRRRQVNLACASYAIRFAGKNARYQSATKH